MKFSHKDKKDERIVIHSTYPLHYPEKVNEAPDQHGLYMLLDHESKPVYIGVSSSEGIRKTILEDSCHILQSDISCFRWFITKSIDDASNLRDDWKHKYSLHS